MMNILQRIAISLFLIQSASAQSQRELQFGNFYTSDKFTGTPAPAKINTPRSRLFQTMIREGAKEGPNFAGYYTVVTWGCGSGCISLAVVDARTGQVYFLPQVLSVTTSLFQEEEKLQYKIDSRLLVVVGFTSGIGGRQSEGKFYYVWKNNQFRLLRAIRKKQIKY